MSDTVSLVSDTGLPSNSLREIQTADSGLEEQELAAALHSQGAGPSAGPKTGLEEFKREMVVETPAFTRPLLLNPGAKVLLLGARRKDKSGGEDLGSNFTRLWAFSTRPGGKRIGVRRNLGRVLTDRSYLTKAVIPGPTGKRIYFYQVPENIFGPPERILAYDWSSGNQVQAIQLERDLVTQDMAVGFDEKALYALLFDRSSLRWFIRSIGLKNGKVVKEDLTLVEGGKPEMDSGMPTQFIVSPDDSVFYVTFNSEPNSVHSLDAVTGERKLVFQASDQVVDRYVLGGKRLAVSPDGKTLFVATRHGDIEAFDTQSGRRSARLRLPPESHGPVAAIDLQVESSGSLTVLSVGLGFSPGASWYHRVDRLAELGTGYWGDTLPPGQGAGLEEASLTRRRLGLSQTELGQALAAIGYNNGQQIPPPTISQWETGTHPVPEEVLDLLLQLYTQRAPEHLLKTRQLLGLSQTELGQALAALGYNNSQLVPQETISQWETGTSPVPETVLDLLLQLYTQRAREQLLKTRQRLGLSQAELTQALAAIGYNNGQPVSVTAISSWETGTHPVPEEVLDFLPRLTRRSVESSLRDHVDTLPLGQGAGLEEGVLVGPVAANLLVGPIAMLIDALIYGSTAAPDNIAQLAQALAKGTSERLTVTLLREEHSSQKVTVQKDEPPAHSIIGMLQGLGVDLGKEDVTWYAKAGKVTYNEKKEAFLEITVSAAQGASEADSKPAAVNIWGLSLLWVADVLNERLKAILEKFPEKGAVGLALSGFRTKPLKMAFLEDSVKDETGLAAEIAHHLEHLMPYRTFQPPGWSVTLHRDPKPMGALFKVAKGEIQVPHVPTLMAELRPVPTNDVDAVKRIINLIPLYHAVEGKGHVLTRLLSDEARDVVKKYLQGMMDFKLAAKELQRLSPGDFSNPAEAGQFLVGVWMAVQYDWPIEGADGISFYLRGFLGNALDLLKSPLKLPISVDNDAIEEKAKPFFAQAKEMWAVQGGPALKEEVSGPGQGAGLEELQESGSDFILSERVQRVVHRLNAEGVPWQALLKEVRPRDLVNFPFVEDLVKPVVRAIHEAAKDYIQREQILDELKKRLPQELLARPYGLNLEDYQVGNVMRTFSADDGNFKGKISEAIRNAEPRAEREGRRVQVLVIGAGAGMVVYDIRKQFPSVRLSFINKEPIELGESPDAAAEVFSRYTTLQEKDGAHPFVSKQEAKEFLEYFSKNVLIHDVDQGFPFGDESLDVVLVSMSTFEYIQKKDHLIREVKRILKKGGEGFVNSFASFAMEGMELEEFFATLPEKEFIFIPGLLHVVNRNPSNVFPQLELVSSTSRIVFPGFPQYNNVYRLRNYPWAGLEEVESKPGTQGVDAGYFAASAVEGKSVILLGPSAMEVPGMREAVERLTQEGKFSKRLLVLPSGMIPASSKAAELLEIPPPLALLAYADHEHDAVMNWVLEYFGGLENVSIEKQGLDSLPALIQQILLNLGVPSDTATEEAVRSFLEAVGLEEAA
ncbi:MAG: methyltransferase domain-containing protein [Candidatus Omnitrophica bacterium]|nr:methyltransferase domain-containing protein [Candidatus Omnitrophota bacterium]